MSKPKANQQFLDEAEGPLFSARFIVAIALMVLGIAWIVVYYTVARVDPTVFPAPKAGGPKFLGDWGSWNYLIGFGLFMIGLAVSAHPVTPLGRGRGVVVGMLGCFVVGLIWICVFYLFSNTDHASNIPVMNDLGQYNLMVGIAFMAVGFTFATRWE